MTTALIALKWNVAQFVGVTCKSCGRDFELVEVEKAGTKPPPWDDSNHVQTKAMSVL
jgi:hypothetical protein